MKKNYFILFIFLVSLSDAGIGQQLPNWGTYYENGFVWNPALTARWNFWEVTATHRQEWTGFQNAPQFSTLGFQFPFIQKQTTSCIGGFISNDEAGPYNNLVVSGNYAYKIKPKWFGNRRDVLTFGFGARFQQFSFTPESYTPFEGFEGDPLLIGESINSTSPNLSVGVFYNSVTDFYTFKSHYYGGISVVNFIPSRLTNLPDGSIGSVPNVHLHGGFRYFPFRAKHYFEPSVMITYAPLRPINVIAHTRFEKVDNYWLAAGLVTSGDAFFQAGIILTEDSFVKNILNGGILRIGFKADYSLGKIRRYAGAGYEIYLAYQFELE